MHTVFIEALVAAIFCTSYDQNICGNSACHKQYRYELFQLQHNNDRNNNDMRSHIDTGNTFSCVLDII